MKFAMSALLLVLVASCSIEKNERSNVPKPQRQDGVSATFQMQNGGGFGLDGTRTIIVDITKYDDQVANPDQASLPSCSRPFSADDDIGVLSCDGDEENKAAIYARQVRQICSGANNFNPIEPKEGLSLENCRKVSLQFYKFDPAITVKIEQNP